MRAGALAAVLALGCQGTSGGVPPDAREHDAAVDPCADPTSWTTAPLRPIASYEGFPGTIGVDETYAYWTEDLTCVDAYCYPGAIVLRAPLAGGDREILFESEMDQPGELAVTRDHLFVRIGDQLWRSQKDGSAPEVVGSQYGFVADADALYYWQGGTLIRLAADTLVSTPIGDALEPGSDFQLTDGIAWWLDPQPVEIWRMPLASGVAEIAARISQTGGDSLAVDGLGRAFLSTWNPQDPAAPPVLMRVPADGADAEPIAELWDGIHDVAVDDSHVYWLEANVGRLSRTPLDGGCVEARDQDVPALVMAPAIEGMVVATAGSIALVER